jgi:hypothetical protein
MGNLLLAFALGILKYDLFFEQKFHYSCPTWMPREARGGGGTTTATAPACRTPSCSLLPKPMALAALAATTAVT